MAWKSFEDHPWWRGSRCCLLRAPDGIAAHGCVSPVRFERQGRTVESMQVIDWAAGRLVPAAGLLLFRRCLELGQGTMLAIGGSDDARSVIARVRWFARRNDLCRYARPLRPWRHLAVSANGARSLARLGRNLYWRTMPGLPDAARWSCRKARPGEEVFTHNGDFVPLSRSRAWFDYLLRCPAVRAELLILEEAGAARGHAFLANVRGSVRVADFVVAGPATQTGRVAAFAALVRHLAARQECAEVVAASSLNEMGQVFAACGLRPRGSSPVYLADPRKLLPADAPIEITLAIGDAFYLDSAGYQFVC
jgi:hypothetical protein